jgi:hypothetical protein
MDISVGGDQRRIFIFEEEISNSSWWINNLCSIGHSQKETQELFKLECHGCSVDVSSLDMKTKCCNRNLCYECVNKISLWSIDESENTRSCPLCRNKI